MSLFPSSKDVDHVGSESRRVPPLQGKVPCARLGTRRQVATQCSENSLGGQALTDTCAGWVR